MKRNTVFLDISRFNRVKSAVEKMAKQYFLAFY